MKALTFEHVDGIQGFAGPFKRILFLPVMLSRFKKRNLFTSIEFTKGTSQRDELRRTS